MALLFADSFDHYVAAAVTSKWSAVFGNFTITTGRTGSGGAGRLSVSASTTNYLTKNFAVGHSTLYIGFAYNSASIPGGSVGMAVLGFIDVSTFQVQLVYTPSQKLAVYRQGTLLGTGTTTYASTSWQYIEMKVIFATGTGGSVVVRINGVTELNLTGINTAPSGNASADRFRIGYDGLNGSIDGFFTVNYDDLYALDDTGSTSNTFLGDIKVEVIAPNAAGNYSQFLNTAGTSTNNYTYVDDTTTDDDTTYVQSDVNGNRDSYAFSNLSAATPGTIYGIQIISYARKSDAGSKQIAAFIRMGGTNYDQTAVSLPDTYSSITNVLDLNPDGSVAWTVTTINALEAGVKVAS